jgi:hypothetical protein
VSRFVPLMVLLVASVVGCSTVNVTGSYSRLADSHAVRGVAILGLGSREYPVWNQIAPAAAVAETLAAMAGLHSEWQVRATPWISSLCDSLRRATDCRAPGPVCFQQCPEEFSSRGVDFLIWCYPFGASDHEERSLRVELHSMHPAPMSGTYAGAVITSAYGHYDAREERWLPARAGIRDHLQVVVDRLARAGAWIAPPN